MEKPRVGLVTFGDERDDMWDKVFKNLAEPRHAELRDYLKTLPIELHSFAEVARSREDINGQVDQLRGSQVDMMIAHTPCWTSPNLVLHGVQRLGLPVALMTSKSAATHGMVGFFGAGGAMHQVGIEHIRIRDEVGSASMTAKLLPFVKAAAAANALKGEVFGLFGGRSLGIDTGSIDPLQWRRMFGERPAPDCFVDAHGLPPRAHLEMQAALQPFVDNAISKTINVPVDYPFDAFRSLYEEAYQLGLKGCTTFRPNPVTGAVLEPGEESEQPAGPHCCGLDRESD